LQRFGSTTVLAAILESRPMQSWTLKQSIDGKNKERIYEMISNLAAMIAFDLQSSISANSWKSLKHYTNALDAYYKYSLLKNPDFLSFAANESIKAIRSEKRYKKPYDLLNVLELTYINIGRSNDAIEYSKKAFGQDFSSPYAWFNQGSILFYLEKYDHAIEAYNTAIEIDPQYAEAWNDEGTAHHSLNRYEDAIKAYNKAIEIDPQYAETWHNKGTALHSLNRYDDAIKAYNKAIEINPQYTEAWHNKGTALNGLRRTDEANAAFAKAKELGYTG
jgi:tetratricopeptide (TPR) repeat protein